MFIDKSSKELYEEYKDIAQKAADLYYASAVLGWDQEVFMPPKGFPYRGRQLATLASLAHEMMTSESYGNVLEELSGRNDLSENEAANIRLSLEDFEKKKKLSFILHLAPKKIKTNERKKYLRQKNNFESVR